MPNPSTTQTSRPTVTGTGRPTSSSSSKWYSIDCDCGFTARSHNNGEMEQIGGLHAKLSHPEMKVGAGDIKKMIVTS